MSLQKLDDVSVLLKAHLAEEAQACFPKLSRTPSTGTIKFPDHRLIGPQWLACPILADLTEQAMFDGVPFGSAGGVMADGDRETKAVADPRLELLLPKASVALLPPPESATINSFLAFV